MSAVDIKIISHRLQLFIELPLSVVSDVKRPRFYFAAEKYRPKLRPEAQSRPITKAGTCCAAQRRAVWQVAQSSVESGLQKHPLGARSAAISISLFANGYGSHFNIT